MSDTNKITIIIVLSGLIFSIFIIGTIKYFSNPKTITVVEKQIVEVPVEVPGPERIVEKLVYTACPTENLNTISKDDYDKLIDMNKRLAERLKTQYEKDPQTRSWARLCLPDEFECLLK